MSCPPPPPPPSLTARGWDRGQLWNGRISHSNDVIGARVYSNVDLHVNVCGSTYCCGCLVNGSVAMVAVIIILLCSGHNSSEWYSVV